MRVLPMLGLVVLGLGLVAPDTATAVTKAAQESGEAQGNAYKKTGASIGKRKGKT